MQHTEYLRAGIEAYVRSSSALDTTESKLLSVQNYYSANEHLLAALGDPSTLSAAVGVVLPSDSCPPPIPFTTVPVHRYEKAAKPSLITQLKRFIFDKPSHKVHPVPVRNYYSALSPPMAPSNKVPKKAPADGNT